MQSVGVKKSFKESVLKNQKVKIGFKYLFVFLLLLVTSYSSISTQPYTPFAFGMYLALSMFGLNIFSLSGLYILAYGVANLSLVSLYSAITVALMGIIVSLIYKKFGRRVNKYIMLVVGLIANVTNIYFNATSLETGIAVGVSVVLGLVFLFACIHFFQATIGKGFNFKLNLDEIIAGSIILVVIAMGLSAITVYEFEFIKMFAVLAILISTYIFKQPASLVVASVIGIGASIYTQNLAYIAVFVSFALIAIGFKSNNKLFSCLAIILCEIVFGLYFNAYQVFSVYSVVSIILAEIIFLSLPAKFINRIGDYLGGVKEKVAVRNIITHTKEGVFKRMNEIANVFSEMDSVFRTMVKGVIPIEDAKKMLTSEALDKVCKNNEEINKLLRMDSKTTLQVFSELVDIGFERGKVTLLDVPQYITSRVGRVNFLINTINQLLASYRHYSVMVTNMDTSRLLIADQLNGVSNILRNLALEVKQNITFDSTKENALIEDLSYKNIFCVEAILYEQNSHVMNATLVIKDSDIKKDVIEKVAGKVVGSNMKVISVEPSVVAGCSIVTLKTRPNHDIIFGSASVGKTGETLSGDTHSLIKIDDGKYMLALCDGMGSGKNANLTSNLAISLIENFYKAGFDNEIILNSVNKLLAQNSEENFSALDICVIDTRKGLTDFIKLGSPEGFIKHKNSTEIIETCGLPMGVLEEMKPHITKKVISDFDIIILTSDGVTDSFSKNQQDLHLYINNITSTNPQTIANEILDRAIDLNDGVRDDDMTVVAVRVFSVS